MGTTKKTGENFKSIKKPTTAKANDEENMPNGSVEFRFDIDLESQLVCARSMMGMVRMRRFEM